MRQPREIPHETEELRPLLALRRENMTAGLCDRVVAAAALARAFHPASAYEPALLEFVERGVERREVEGQCAAGTLFDRFDQLVAVARLVLEEREDEELGAALFRFADGAPRLH